MEKKHCPDLSNENLALDLTNKTDHHNLTEILLKVLLNTIIPNPRFKSIKFISFPNIAVYRYNCF